MQTINISKAERTKQLREAFKKVVAAHRVSLVNIIFVHKGMPRSRKTVFDKLNEC